MSYWLENCLYNNSRGVIYELKMFCRIDHGNLDFHQLCLRLERVFKKVVDSGSWTGRTWAAVAAAATCTRPIPWRASNTSSSFSSSTASSTTTTTTAAAGRRMRQQLPDNSGHPGAWDLSEAGFPGQAVHHRVRPSAAAKIGTKLAEMERRFVLDYFLLLMLICWCCTKMTFYN